MEQTVAGSGSSKQPSGEESSNELQVFKSNLLFELLYAQKEAARFLELAYLALKEDPVLARKVRKTADEAQNQHMMTHGLMVEYQDTAKHVIRNMLPILKKGLEKKKEKLVQKTLGKVLGYVTTMIEKTKEKKERYCKMKGEIQSQISDIVVKNLRLEKRQQKIEIKKEREKDMLLASKDEYVSLKTKKEGIAIDVREYRKKRHDFLEKSIQTQEDKHRESLVDGLLIPGLSVAAAAVGGPVYAGVVLFGGLAASNFRRDQSSKQAVDASEKVKEEINESEKKVDDAEKRMLEIKQESIEMITMMRKLALESADQLNKESLEKACRELGRVGEHFGKILWFWENFAAKLTSLNEEQDTLDALLETIDDEDFEEDIDQSFGNVKKIWSSFGMVCAYYVKQSESEIHDLFAFLSDPVDQLSIEECTRRKEKVLAKMEAEIKTLEL